MQCALTLDMNQNITMMNTTIRTYLELSHLNTFDERLNTYNLVVELVDLLLVSTGTSIKHSTRQKSGVIFENTSLFVMKGVTLEL